MEFVDIDPTPTGELLGKPSGVWGCGRSHFEPVDWGHDSISEGRWRLHIRYVGAPARWVAFCAAAIAASQHLAPKLGATTTSVRPEVMQPQEDVRGVFGVEGVEGGPEGERPEKRARVEKASADEDEEAELNRSGVFDDSDDGAYEEFHASGSIPGASRARPGVVEPEEGREVRTAKPPYVPSEKERRQHNATHFPLRSWCEHCVRGRGIASKHSQGDGEEIGGVGEMHVDYCF